MRLSNPSPSVNLASPGPIGGTTPAAIAGTTLTANGAVTFTAGTSSSSTTTGTLVVTGGVGISGTCFAGGFETAAAGLSRAGRFIINNQIVLESISSGATLEINTGVTGTLRGLSASTISAGARFNLPSFTVGTLPAATLAGGIIYVSDAGGNGPCLAITNGTNWKRCDNTSTTVS